MKKPPQFILVALNQLEYFYLKRLLEEKLLRMEGEDTKYVTAEKTVRQIYADILENMEFDD